MSDSSGLFFSPPFLYSLLRENFSAATGGMFSFSFFFPGRNGGEIQREGREEGWRKEGRKEEEEEGRREGGRSQLHWYEYDAEAAARATSPLLSSLLSSPIPPYPPRERGERGREGTVSMATAEQR